MSDTAELLENEPETVRMQYRGPVDPETGIFGVRVRAIGRRKQSVYLQFRKGDSGFPECDVPVELLHELEARRIRLRPVGNSLLEVTTAAHRADKKAKEKKSKNLSSFTPLPEDKTQTNVDPGGPGVRPSDPDDDDDDMGSSIKALMAEAV